MHFESWNAPPPVPAEAGIRLGASHPAPIAGHYAARKRALAGSGEHASAYACRMASISIEILISSPTTTPPASSAMFQVRPKSLRWIFVSAVAPMR